MKNRKLLTAVASIGVLAVAFGAQPGHARSMGNIYVDAEAGFSRSYAAMPLSNPTAEVATPDAITCGTPAVQHCDAGRLFVDLDPGETATLTIELTWTDPAGIDDFDLYLYREPDHAPLDVPVASSTRATTGGTTFSERVEVPVAQGQIHQVVVNHYAGVNTTGYTLTATLG